MKQGKTVIVVKDVPGFYVNRSLGPYMAECMALLQSGVETEKCVVVWDRARCVSMCLSVCVSVNMMLGCGIFFQLSWYVT